MKVDIDNIKNKAVPILKNAGAIRSALFGSTVRGETNQNSDIDMLVELPKHISLLDFIRLKLNLEKGLGKKVDLVEYSAVKNRIKKHILNEQVQIL